MYIDRIEMQNIRTFDVGSNVLSFVHPDGDFRPARGASSAKDKRLPRPRLPNVTLLLGDNGSGKTSVLRALAAIGFGPAAKDLLRDASMVRFGEENALISGELRLHEQDGSGVRPIHAKITLQRRGERLYVDPQTSEATGDLWRPIYESTNDAFLIVGYGATRRVERLDSYDSGARARSRAVRDLRVQSLFEEAFSLIPLGSWLPSLKATNPGRYTQVVHLLTRLLAPGGYAFTGKQAANGDYLYQRGETPVPFQSLSDGYRAFIGWVSDLLHHVSFGSPSGKKLVENQGVVLVDEIDLHLHPKWQMQVIKTVARALPKMQFVFTSHSPLVAGSLEWMNIITLKTGAKSNRTVAKRLKQSIHGLDADQILLSDFFGLKTTMAATKQRQLDDITERIRAGDASAPLELIREMSTGTEEDE